MIETKPLAQPKRRSELKIPLQPAAAAPVTDAPVFTAQEIPPVDSAPVLAPVVAPQAVDASVALPLPPANNGKQAEIAVPIIAEAKAESPLPAVTPSVQKLLDTGAIQRDELPALVQDGKWVHPSQYQKRLNAHRDRIRAEINQQLQAEGQAAQWDQGFESNLQERITRTEESEKERTRMAEEAEQARIQERIDFVENFGPRSVEDIDTNPEREPSDVARDVAEVFDHNIGLATRIIRSQINRLTQFRNAAAGFDKEKIRKGFEKRRLRINFTVRESPIHFERVAVADAQDNLHRQQQERRAWEGRRDRDLRALGIDTSDQACFGARLAISQEIQKAQRANVQPDRNIINRYRDIASIDSVDDSVKIESFLKDQAMGDRRYRAYLAANDATYSTQFQGDGASVFTTAKGQTIKIENCRQYDENIVEARNNLAQAQQEEQRVAAIESKGIKASELAQHYEAQLVELTQLTDYLTVEHGGYRPEMSAVENNFQMIQGITRKLQGWESHVTQLPPHFVNKRTYTGAVAEQRKMLDGWRTSFNQLINPSVRSRVLDVVQRGEALRAQLNASGAELNSVPPVERFYVVLADTLQGLTNTANVNDLVDLDEIPPAPIQITPVELDSIVPLARLQEEPEATVGQPQAGTAVPVEPLLAETPVESTIDIGGEFAALVEPRARQQWIADHFVSHLQDVEDMVQNGTITTADLNGLLQSGETPITSENQEELRDVDSLQILNSIAGGVRALQTSENRTGIIYTDVVRVLASSQPSQELLQKLCRQYSVDPSTIYRFTAGHLVTKLNSDPANTNLQRNGRTLLLGLYAQLQSEQQPKSA